MNRRIDKKINRNTKAMSYVVWGCLPEGLSLRPRERRLVQRILRKRKCVWQGHRVRCEIRAREMHALFSGGVPSAERGA